MSQTLEAAQAFARSLTVTGMQSLVDIRIQRALSSLLPQLGAHASGIWVHPHDREVLVLAYNAVVGDQAAAAAPIEQPLDSGLISKCFREQQTVCHQGMFRHPQQSDRVDRQLGQLTAHQIAAPFALFGVPCGVISVIQKYGMPQQPARWGFDERAIEHFSAVAGLVAAVLERNWIAHDWDDSATESP